MLRSITCGLSMDHPRTCGEKPRRFFHFAHEVGSPPHMRGKDAFISPYGDIPGITPAHAGKRIGFSAFSGLSGDHPRTCGEKSLMRSLHTGRLGSPPHMRGKVGHCLASNSILGITPAHAGKRSPAFSSNSYGRDHPRTCGEKPALRFVGLFLMGSPPHMRGKEIDGFGFSRRYGITPAHAGKSCHFFSRVV